MMVRGASLGTVIFLLISLTSARPHIEDELVEIKDDLGSVFTDEIPADYFQRTDLQDCHARFHKRSVNQYRQAMFDGVSVNGTVFPHLALIGYRGRGSDEIEWKCSGSLIAKRFVLTASQCTKGERAPEVVRLGDVDLTSADDDHFEQQYKVINVFNHPDVKSMAHNLALLELNQDVKLTPGVCPACIWTKSAYPYDWYDLGANANSSLLKTQLAPVEYAECTTKLKNLSKKVHKDQLCATGTASDSCQGDLGGPIQISMFTYEHLAPFLVGIVTSRGYCNSEDTDIYQKVAPHLKWIKSIVKESLDPLECIQTYRSYLEPMQMEGETEAVDPYFSRVYIHWDDNRTDNLCGGTLVDYNVVLTSAHCTYNIRGEEPTKISIIDHEAKIVEIERHPSFKKGSFYNDVALLRLDRYVNHAKWIAPACLPYPSALEGHDIAPETFSCRTPKAPFENKLQIYIPTRKRCTENDISTDQKYKARFSKGLGNAMSCFGTDYRLVPGLGEIDKGGPLLSRDETIIFGVNAYATDCGSFNPLVTTNVAPLIPWIEQFTLKQTESIQTVEVEMEPKMEMKVEVEVKEEMIDEDMITTTGVSSTDETVTLAE
ncbi:polyserase-2-like [Uranotaenia lowii]|uniref:polyserase-2-like n=1 Tax=Uranotaenia lowii TaxID=190385 RepID=UPI00247AF3C2|nr:polyserase-2-like [Uranotaenia lowii]